MDSGLRVKTQGEPISLPLSDNLRNASENTARTFDQNHAPAGKPKVESFVSFILDKAKSSGPNWPHQRLYKSSSEETKTMNNKMKSTTCGFRRLTLLGAFLLLGAINPAHAIVPTVVVPNSARTTEGNSNNGYPFDLSEVGLTSQRYQQVYAASQFGGGGLITQIVFRPDATFGHAFTSMLSDIQIDLSTTSAADDGLSSIYANNVGADDTVVFARGPLTLSSAFTGPPDGPKDFDIIITLSHPFLYNPALGNLLLDVRNFGGGITTFFDAVSTTGDGVSRLFNQNVNNTTGTTDTGGLVTGFNIVPEPGSAALLLVGGGTLLAWFGGCRRRQRH